jgi:hypothetical protein
MYRALKKSASISKLPAWQSDLGDFTKVVGITSFGDFFLRDPASGEYAILQPLEAEMNSIGFDDEDGLAEFLSNPDIVKEVLRPKDVAALEKRLGTLGPEEVFFPVPYPCLGGSGKLSTYDKGDAWVFAEIAGQTPLGGEGDESGDN